MTAAVWVRGMLEEDFGVKPEQIQWFTGGAERPGRKERIELPAEIAARVTPIPPDETLFNMLMEGRLDAVMCATSPRVARGERAQVRSLFPDSPRGGKRLLPETWDLPDHAYSRCKRVPACK